MISTPGRHSDARRHDGRALDAADWFALRGCAMFRELDAEILRRLCGDRHALVYTPGQHIFSQGDVADGFFVILDGWVKIFRIAPSGEEAVMGVFTRGESIADVVAFMGGAFPASAQAASDLRMVKIDATRLKAALAEDPTLASALLGSIVAHTDRIFGEIASLKLMSAPRRLADFLARQAHAEAGAASLRLPYEKGLLAGRLGMSPETLSRAFAALRAQGVAVERERVSIADVANLAAFARNAASA
jgi:CRP-like cAMP-binding protein